MSNQRRRGKRKGNKGARTAAPAEFWRSAPEPPEPPDISPALDPTALLRSMGSPPLPGQSDALRQMCLVVVEAQKSAKALAFSADLLDLDED